MEDYDIKIDTTEVIEKMNTLISKIDEMDTLLEKMKKEMSDSRTYWQGEEAESVQESMDAFSSTFSEVKVNSSTFTTFLQETSDKYKKLDDDNVKEANSELKDTAHI